MPSTTSGDAATAGRKKIVTAMTPPEDVLATYKTTGNGSNAAGWLQGLTEFALPEAPGRIIQVNILRIGQLLLDNCPIYISVHTTAMSSMDLRLAVTSCPSPMCNDYS